jgi:hypothetical protein
VNPIIRKWSEQIIRNQRNAAGFALIASFVSFFNCPTGWLSTVVIALVTLQNGTRSGLTVAAWAILPAAAMLYLGQSAIFINITLHYLLILGFAVLLRRNNSWMGLLQLSTLLGIVATIIIHFFVPEFQSWLVDQFALAAKEYQSMAVFSFQKTNMNLWFKYLDYFATGLLVLVATFANLMTLFIARWWQSLVTPAIGVQKEFNQTRIHYSAAFGLVVLLAGLHFNNPLLTNVLVVAVMPFIFCGLSLFHAYCATKKNNSVYLFLFYGLFIFLSPCIIFTLIVFGWLDSFVNFRKKFTLSGAVEE